MKPQMIVNTLSYDESPLQKVKRARAHLGKAGQPGEADRNAYFICREKLLEVYAVLKNIEAKRISFQDEGQLAQFVEKYAAGLTEEKVAFALVVFEEIGLLEIQKNDKIHIVIHAGKRELSKSAVYQMYVSGEN